MRFSVARTLLLCASVLAVLPAARTLSAGDPATSAHAWLVSQTRASGLVDSYADASDVCYTYDQAVAAIAFVHAGDVPRARAVLDRMKALQAADGSWYTAYTCSGPVPQEWAKHVGPVLWMPLAVAQYERVTGDTATYRPMALSAIAWSMRFQQADGGLNGGLDPAGAALGFASTEHNQDAYAALRYFDPARADGVKAFLDAVWVPEQGRWMAGRGDYTDPLDVNAWGVSALGTEGVRSYGAALDYAMRIHRASASYGTAAIDAFDFNNPADDVWLEGTGQMIVALRAAGRGTEAAFFLSELREAQRADGGVPYSVRGTYNGYWTMSTAPSVAATGWLVIAEKGVNPLHPEPLPPAPASSASSIPASSAPASSVRASSQPVSSLRSSQASSVRSSSAKSRLKLRLPVLTSDWPSPR